MFEMRPYRRHQMQSYDPFAQMAEFERRFFDDDFFSFPSSTAFRTDITDEGDAYQLKADLPGFDKKDIHLDLEGDNLVIRAERHSEHEEKGKRDKYVRCERTYGAYQRSFDVSGIRTEDIKAKYQDGVLTLTLPKKAQGTLPDSRHLEIE